jgi:hypothetical protein
MNSSRLVTTDVLPLRAGVPSFDSACPAALICSRSSDRADRLPYRHSFSKQGRREAVAPRPAQVIAGAPPRRFRFS